jgi:hypothetical protein
VADVSGTYQKSPEYMDEYATTTKAEEHSSQRNVRDLFPKQSKTSSEQNELNLDENVSRL